MNLNDNPTKEQLAELLRPWDDRAAHHVLWVDRTGEVHVTPVSGDVAPASFPQEHPEAQLCLRVFEPGYDFVGPGAARDIGWVEDLFVTLTEQWPGARGKPEAVAVEDW